MKKKKKSTLADLEARMAQWFAAYVQDHELLSLGKGVTLVLKVEHHKSTHLYSSNIKTGKAHPAVSPGEPMTENDWKIIFRLPVIKKPEENTIFHCLRNHLAKMRDANEPLEIPYHHARQINTIFEGNGLMYHVFKVSGSTSTPWRGQPKFKVYKRL